MFKLYTEGSKGVAQAALLLAMTTDRDDEDQLKATLDQLHIKAAAADYGGEFVTSVKKIVERAVVAAKREGVIKETHTDEGAVAGAAHEALAQIMSKAMGWNVGGKIGIARKGDHLAVAVFFAVGLLHLNDITIGLGHRAVP